MEWTPLQNAPDGLKATLSVQEADAVARACWARMLRNLDMGVQPDKRDEKIANSISIIGEKDITLTAAVSSFRSLTNALQEYAKGTISEVFVLQDLGEELPVAREEAVRRLDAGQNAEKLVPEFEGAIFAHESNLHERIQELLAQSGDGQ